MRSNIQMKRRLAVLAGLFLAIAVNAQESQSHPEGNCANSANCAAGDGRVESNTNPDDAAAKKQLEEHRRQERERMNQLQEGRQQEQLNERQPQKQLQESSQQEQVEERQRMEQLEERRRMEELQKSATENNGQ